MNPDYRETILKKTAEKITLNKKQEIESIENNEEVSHWKEKGLIVRCKDSIVVNMNDKIYQSKAQILGCIDALKIILAVTTEQTHPGNIQEVIDQLVKISNKYVFSDDRKIVLRLDANDEPRPILVEVFDDLNDTQIIRIQPSVLSNDEESKEAHLSFENKTVHNLDIIQSLKRSEVSSEQTGYNHIYQESLTLKSSRLSIKRQDTDKNTDKNTDKHCCIIFSVSEIKYDNPILNSSGLIEKLSKFTGLSQSKILDNSASLMQAGYTDILSQAVNDHNIYELHNMLLGVNCDFVTQYD